MKNLLSGLFLLLTSATPALALDGTPLCDQLRDDGWWNLVDTCKNSVQSGNFQESAFALCFQLEYQGAAANSLQCVKTIEGKSYTDAEISNCKDFVTKRDALQTLKCLSLNGHKN